MLHTSLVIHSMDLLQGCSMATALAHDVSVYANASGSTVFYCSLDAEGAFDCLPLPIILSKTNGAVPDKYWRILYILYMKYNISNGLKRYSLI